MEAFAYAHPTTKQDALNLLTGSWDSTVVLAGGTDLISLMKNHVSTPKRVVSIRGVKEWNGISSSAAGLRIGALVTLGEIADSAAVKKEFPALAAAADDAASPQLRHMGTLGGNLCQRPRCWYYRNGFGLFAIDANGKPLVPNGENRYHAILGNSGPAYFVSPSTLAPSLLAFGAKIKLAGKGGEREMDLKDFFVIPKNESEREHAIGPDEILTEILLPASSRGMRSANYEVRQKMELDWPLATASVALSMDGSHVRSAKIVMGHVAPIPWIADSAAASLAGKTITPETAEAAGKAAVAGAKPLSQNAYKVQIAKVCVKRALLAAAKEGA